MCLEIIATIAPDAKNRISAERLSKLSGLAVTTKKVHGESSLHFAVTGGCSCEFLSDNAEFEGEAWILAPREITGIGRCNIYARQRVHKLFISGTLA